MDVETDSAEADALSGPSGIAGLSRADAGIGPCLQIYSESNSPTGGKAGMKNEGPGNPAPLDYVLLGLCQV